MSRLFWTKEKMDILITYLRNGLSKAQIAKKMDTTYDAVGNAVVRYSLQKHIIPKTTTKKFTNNINLDDLGDENFEQKIKEAKLNWKVKHARKQKDKNKQFEIALFWLTRTYRIIINQHIKQC